MPHIYIAHWEWNTTDPEMPHWRAPGGDALGTLDLRSLPQCGKSGPLPEGFGIFVYPTQRVIARGRYLGDDPQRFLSPIDRSFLETFLGVTLIMSRFDHILEELFSVHYDPAGQNRWKPLRTSRREGLKLTLGGFGLLIDRPFREGDLRPALDVRIADYRRHRLAGVPVEVLRRWTGSDMLKFFGRMGNDLLSGMGPPEFEGDGFAVPATIVGDTFVDTNAVLLANHTATGPNSGFTWTDIQGTWDILDNTARQPTANNTNRECRANQDLSTDDHYSQIKLSVTNADAARNWGVIIRKDGTATETYYHMDMGSGTSCRTFKRVAGVFTALGTDTTVVEAVGDVVKGEATSADLIKRYLNGVEQNSVSDTSITGNLRAGITARRGSLQLDDFEGGDLASLTTAQSMPGILFEVTSGGMVGRQYV